MFGKPKNWERKGATQPKLFEIFRIYETSMSLKLITSQMSYCSGEGQSSYVYVLVPSLKKKTSAWAEKFGREPEDPAQLLGQIRAFASLHFYLASPCAHCVDFHFSLILCVSVYVFYCFQVS